MGEQELTHGTPLDGFPLEDWLNEAATSGAAAVSSARLAAPLRPALLDRLIVEISRTVYADLARAEHLSAACDALAHLVATPAAHAVALRARGHLRFAGNHPVEAADLYERAVEALREAGNRVEMARTMSSALQALIYLGRYSAAEAWSVEAEQIFAEVGDELRLARLWSNRGNILYRQDRYQEALATYNRARTALERIGDARDLASVVSNMATVQISMGRFEEAHQSYKQARQLCVDAGLTRMVAAADYNIAYLHYLRGDYLRAIDVYSRARQTCTELADQYHEALCDLDEAEMYLELNLSREGARLARRAAQSFESLGMNYERAKAMVSEAVSLHHVGAARTGRGLMRQAREILSAETNHLWPALIDLYMAISYLSDDQTAMAGRLATSASTRLSGGALPGKKALCDLVRARVRLRMGKPADARALCQTVLALPNDERLPSIDYLAWFTLGEVEEQQGQHRAAWTAWQKTREAVERLRNSLGGEDLRISFLKDKVEVYENLVWLWMNRLAGAAGGPTARDALELMQEAKSRSLADFLDSGGAASGVESEHDYAAELRAELSSLYRRIEAAMLTGGEAAVQVQQLARQAREAERQIADRRREREQERAMDDAELRHVAGPAGDVQAYLPKNAQLVEYFAARGRYVAALVTHRQIEFVDLGPVDVVSEKVRLTRFQLSKFRLGPEYLEKFGPRLQEAIRTHLRGLFDELVRPLRAKLREEHLVVAPYGGLHQLPFHALMDGDRCIADDFTVSYTPSSSVLAACLRRGPSAATAKLVFGIADDRSPAIEREAREVARLLGDAELYLGDAASEQRLRERASQLRVLHIATHGFFRRDNPLFSAIRLGDGFLSLYDLYRLKLDTELVTLSGCSTGLNEVVGGDELLGLTRGLLHAGSRGVLLSLWDVQDESTAEYMSVFYSELAQGRNSAQASRTALLTLRQRYEHPYHWAPFILVGDWNSSKKY